VHKVLEILRDSLSYEKQDLTRLNADYDSYRLKETHILLQIDNIGRNIKDLEKAIKILEASCLK
jgi:hypothetical protein